LSATITIWIVIVARFAGPIDADPGDDEIDTETDQLGRESGEVGLCLRVALLDGDVLPFHEPESPQTLPNRLGPARVGRRRRENSDSGNFSRLLRPGGARRGEQRDDADHEGAPLHH
jgi:hypothetical protein